MQMVYPEGTQVRLVSDPSRVGVCTGRTRERGGVRQPVSGVVPADGRDEKPTNSPDASIYVHLLEIMYSGNQPQLDGQQFSTQNV